MVHGKLHQWKGWLNVRIDEHTFKFVGYRKGENDARLDASRRAVLFLRHRYNEVFAESCFKFIPQECDGGKMVKVPYPNNMDTDQGVEIAREIGFSSWQYEKLRGEYLKASNDLLRVQNENRALHQELEKRQRVDDGDQSSCGETPATPPHVPDRQMVPCQEGQSHGEGVISRRVGTARHYFRRFKVASQSKQEKPALEDNKGKGPAEDDEEEEPMERIFYTTSNPPSDE